MAERGRQLAMALLRMPRVRWTLLLSLSHVPIRSIYSSKAGRWHGALLVCLNKGGGPRVLLARFSVLAPTGHNDQSCITSHSQSAWSARSFEVTGTPCARAT